MKQIISFSEENLDINVLGVVSPENAVKEFRSCVIGRIQLILGVKEEDAVKILDDESDNSVHFDVYGVERGYDGYATISYGGYNEYLRMVDAPTLIKRNNNSRKAVPIIHDAKTFVKEVFVPWATADTINSYLHHEPESEDSCFGEDEFFVKSVRFEDGKQMDIKFCGVQYQEGESNLPWTEAVLFDSNGAEICCSEPSDEYFGEWTLSSDGNVYTAHVMAKKETPEENLEVETTAGIIRAYKSADPGQPGICVMLQPAGYDAELDMSYVSVYEDPEYRTVMQESPEDVCIMTYGNVFSEDYTSKTMIRREDILSALDID